MGEEGCWAGQGVCYRGDGRAGCGESKSGACGGFLLGAGFLGFWGGREGGFGGGFGGGEGRFLALSVSEAGGWCWKVCFKV